MTALAVDRNVIKTMSTELGLQYEFIRDPAHRIVQDENSRDPDVVYLHEPGFPIRYCPDPRAPTCDALVYFNGDTRAINWDHASVEFIHKILHSAEMVCSQCQDIPKDPHDCHSCGNFLCTVCLYKIVLTAENKERFRRGDFEINWPCPECGFSMGSDVMYSYFKILGQKDEFSKEQQDILTYLQAAEPDANFLNSKDGIPFYENLIEHRNQIRSKRFKKGTKVEVFGTANVEWNGKMAVIIGDNRIKNKAIQWPIELQDGSKEKVWLKPRNMRKVDCRFWRGGMAKVEISRKKVVDDSDEPDLDTLWDDDDSD